MFIAIVQIPMPPRDQETALRQGLQSAPLYRDLSDRGLLRKYYLNGEAGGGGVYLWRTREAAENWYTDAWRATMKARFGVTPQVQIYESNLTVDNTTGTTLVTSNTPEPTAPDATVSRSTDP